MTKKREHTCIEEGCGRLTHGVRCQPHAAIRTAAIRKQRGKVGPRTTPTWPVPWRRHKWGPILLDPE